MPTELNRLALLLLEKIPERSVGANENGVLLDYAGIDAMSVIGEALGGAEEHAVARKLMLEIALELLNELPKPSPKGEFLGQLKRRSGAAS